MTGVDVGFERLARPLLELIQRVTGLETTFVTRIDWAQQQQEVVLALNTADLQVAEGSALDWSDSMCRCALLSGKEHTSDAPADFPGSMGVEQVGLRTFVALPILAEEAILGTVCGASRRTVELSSDVVEVIRLVAESMAFQMSLLLEAREQRERADRAELHSLTDPLTQLANRRAFASRFEEELARSGREGRPLAVLSIDVDRFKAVNDTYGHGGGDQVLQTLGGILRRTVRSDDIPARLAVDGRCAPGRRPGDGMRAGPARGRRVRRPAAAERCRRRRDGGRPDRHRLPPGHKRARHALHPQHRHQHQRVHPAALAPRRRRRGPRPQQGRRQGRQPALELLRLSVAQPRRAETSSMAVPTAAWMASRVPRADASPPSNSQST